MKNNTLPRSAKPVAIWLLVGVAMIIVQIILGGITRLTGSGLSITEWKPILGAIPPIGDQAWQIAFEKYQEIAQFKKLNSHFTLPDFKFIYFWEWFHRLWGRLLGVVFFIPFLIFWKQGRFKKDMVTPLIVLFVLGGLQGLIGWVMVMSGLNDENLYVSHFRLAIHFIAAMILLVYTFWFALKLLVPEKALVIDASLKKFAWVIIALLTVQLVYGAFMAGLKAGAFAPTWPSINGQMIPENMTTLGERQWSFFAALGNHPIAIHFVHRNMAYLLTVLIILWSLKAIQNTGSTLFNKIRLLPLALVLVQVFLGIFSVLTSLKAVKQGFGIFEWNAQLHQIVAMLLLLSLVAVVYVLRNKKTVSVPDEKLKKEAVLTA
ncbi:COX15/CtaA family protein [Adhaeribacter terreus]|uniref:COX15/CtaA family protein n=1 Tax=Adhaeribacter terreus TaxID=529703 RepID=A0ABW0E9Z5_9BACT